MPQQGVYEQFLEEQQRKGSQPPPTPEPDLEVEFESFLEEQKKVQPSRTPTPSPSPTPLKRPSTGRVLMPTERQEFGSRSLDLDTALNQSSQRRMKAEAALVQKSKAITRDPNWRKVGPIEEPAPQRPVQGPPVFKPKAEELKPGAMPKVGTLKPQGFNAAEFERRIVETVADPANASKFTADEWAGMEAAARDIAKREADAQTQERLREIEDQQQVDKFNAPSYPVQLANRFLRGATQTATSTIRGASLLHPEIEADLRRKGVLQTPQEQEQMMRRLAPVDPTDDSFLAKGAEALGSAVPFVGASAMGGAAGLPAWIAPAVLGAATNAGQTYEEAVAAGEDPERAKQAAIIGALIGLTEGAGVGRLGGKAPSIARAARRGVVSGLGLTAAKEFGEEGLQEAFNRALNNVNAKIVSGYAPQRALQEGLAESFLLGGLGGGIIGGALSAPGAVTAVRPSRGARYAAALDAKPAESPTPRRAAAVSPPAPMIPPAQPVQTEVIKIPSGPPGVDSGTSAPSSSTAPIPAAAPTIGGEPVSARWLNAQRRQAGQMLGLAPDQIPMVEGQPAAAAEVKPADIGAATAPAKSNGQVLASGLGFLQPLFERSGGNNSPEASGSRRGRVFDTVGAAQTVAQLGSVPFVLRNVIQHASHGAQEFVTQGVGGLIDKAAAKVTGKREVGGFSNPLEAVKEIGQFVADYREGIRQAREAVKRGDPLPGARLKDLPDPETLTNVGRKLSKVLTWINEVPDAGNWNAHFQRSLRDQARAQKSSRKASADDALSRVDLMIERAWAEADHASMRDKNFASNTLGAIKKGLNKASSPITGTDKFGLGDFVIKYTQVPGALVKRGIEYSPLGVIEAGYHASRGDQRRAVQGLARAIVGSTSGAGVGAMLAAFGILVGPEHDKGQAAQLEREEGRRGYSINMSALKRLAAGGWDGPDESRKLQAGDQLVSIDWLQPWALQASAGAEIYNAAKRGELKLSGVAGSAASSLGEWLSVADSQTVLRNIKQALPYKAKDDTVVDIVRKTLSPILTGAPASFVPSVARQVRQITDPYVRDTRPEESKGLGAGFEEAANKVKEGIPGLSQTLPTRPSVLTGEPKKTAIGGYSAPVRASKLISPAGVTTYEPQPIAREADRLRQSGFEVSFGTPKRRLFEPTSALREREAQFALDFSDAAKRMIEHPIYDEYVDEVKAAALNNLAKYLRERTVRELRDRSLEKIITDAAKGVARRKKEEE
jgi:hypothetical protein